MASRAATGDGAVKHLYVHVPFCSRRCSYCDFAIAVRRTVPAGEFVGDVLREAERWIQASAVQPLATVYLGGGTPSKLGTSGVAMLLTGLKSVGFDLAPAAEVTIESNPEDVDAAAAEAWARAGVNRVSIGIQSFARNVLEWMHRTHDGTQAESAVRAARAGGVNNVSLDLIYALPESIPRAWEDDLDRAIALDPDHISVYGLTIEPRTPLGRWAARGDVLPQTDERAAEEFLMADERLRAAGYDHYEVSNYAKPGRRSAHNSSYWRRVPYLGLGPSAHSFDGASRRWNLRELSAWEAAVRAGRTPVEGEERLTDVERESEEAYLGLRTSDGLALRAPDGIALRTTQEMASVRGWVEAGWASVESDHVRLSAEGWLRLDALAGSLGGRLH